LILFAQGKEAEVEVIYNQAIEKAIALENSKDIFVAKKDLMEFITKKGFELDEESLLFRLLDGDFDIVIKNPKIQLPCFKHIAERL
jgi:hypothetical protein